MGLDTSTKESMKGPLKSNHWFKRNQGQQGSYSQNARYLPHPLTSLLKLSFKNLVFTSYEFMYHTYRLLKFHSSILLQPKSNSNMKLIAVALFWKGCNCIIQSKYLIQPFLLICMLTDPLT